MRTLAQLSALLAVVVVLGAETGKEGRDPPRYTDSFRVDEKDLSTTGRNPFFVLEPGYRLVLESGGPEKEVLVVTVLDATRKVGGIETRVVEERESADGKVVEVSRNYFAICKRTNSVYYFGEDAGGAWMHGENGARFGMMMPGTLLVGARYQQEIAPGVAMDRAEIVDVDKTFWTPAGTFEHCLEILETNPLEPGSAETKVYAPGIGLVKDGSMRLASYGKGTNAGRTGD